MPLLPKLLLGLDNVALDLDDHAGFVDGIGGDGDSLGEAADVVGVVAHADFAALARHDGLLGPLRSGAAAACSNAGEDEGFVAGVGEGEHAVAVATLLYGAVVVFLFCKDNLSAVGFSVFGGFLVLSFHCAHRHDGDQAE